MAKPLAEWKLSLIESLKSRLATSKLTFIHVPKCGGTSVNDFIHRYARSKIFGTNPKHRQPRSSDGVSFAVIRDPVKRFESFLNYRLGEANSRADWPPRLVYLYSDKTAALDEVVAQMTIKEMQSFIPYRSLKWYTKDVDLVLTLEEVIPALKQLGFDVPNALSVCNSSKKIRGSLSDASKEKIKQAFHDDMLVWDQWTRKEATY